MTVVSNVCPTHVLLCWISRTDLCPAETCGYIFKAYIPEQNRLLPSDMQKHYRNAYFSYVEPCSQEAHGPGKTVVPNRLPSLHKRLWEGTLLSLTMAPQKEQCPHLVYTTERIVSRGRSSIHVAHTGNHKNRENDTS